MEKEEWEGKIMRLQMTVICRWMMAQLISGGHSLTFNDNEENMWLVSKEISGWWGLKEVRERERNWIEVAEKKKVWGDVKLTFPCSSFFSSPIVSTLLLKLLFQIDPLFSVEITRRKNSQLIEDRKWEHNQLKREREREQFHVLCDPFFLIFFLWFNYVPPSFFAAPLFRIVASLQMLLELLFFFHQNQRERERENKSRKK